MTAGALRIASLDHLVLTVGDISATVSFYQDILGMNAEQFRPADGTERWALKFGAQKINLHQAGKEFEPKAETPMPGSADLCFLVGGNLDDWAARLTLHGVAIEQGPIKRTGATGPILSLYIRDPDGNLVELSTPL